MATQVHRGTSRRATWPSGAQLVPRSASQPTRADHVPTLRTQRHRRLDVCRPPGRSPARWWPRSRTRYSASARRRTGPPVRPRPPARCDGAGRVKMCRSTLPAWRYIGSVSSRPLDRRRRRRRRARPPSRAAPGSASDRGDRPPPASSPDLGVPAGPAPRPSNGSPRARSTSAPGGRAQRDGGAAQRGHRGDAAAEHEAVGPVVEHDALAGGHPPLGRASQHTSTRRRGDRPRRPRRGTPWALHCTSTSPSTAPSTHVTCVDGDRVVEQRRPRRPTTTVAVARSTSTTKRFGPPPGRPRPLRWPTVTSSTPATSPTAWPAVSTTSPACRRCGGAGTRPRPPVDVMKHTSWLSGLAAVRRPSVGGERAAPRPCRRSRRPGTACGPGRLAEHVHDVALVLGPVGAALERAAGRCRPGDPGVVAGGDGVEAEQVAPARRGGRT